MKEKFPADSDFQECWVVFQTEYEAASQEKYPRPDLRLRIIIMIMHNGLKISANVIFERMKPLYPQFYNYKRSYYPTTPPGFFRKFDFRLRKIIWHNYIRYQYLELKTDLKSFLFLLLPGKLKTWLWPKSSDRRPVVRGERRGVVLLTCWLNVDTAWRGLHQAGGDVVVGVLLGEPGVLVVDHPPLVLLQVTAVILFYWILLSVNEGPFCCSV